MGNMMLTVETPLGTLRAIESYYSGHPGIWIELKRNGEKDFFPLSLVEYTDDEADLPDNTKTIITRVWRDMFEDEYSDRVIHTNVENFHAP